MRPYRLHQADTPDESPYLAVVRSSAANSGVDYRPGGDRSRGEEIERIEQEYTRRINLLDAWRDEEYARVLAGGNVGTERYPVGTGQFFIVGGSVACTGIATAASLWFLQYAARADDAESVLLSAPWNAIVRTGVRLWNECALHTQHTYLSCVDILKAQGEVCSLVNRALQIVREIGGHMDDLVACTADADIGAMTLADMLRAIPLAHACVVTAARDGDDAGSIRPGDGATVAILKVGEGTFWVFDSHGSYDTATACLLAKCASVDSTESLLRQQLDNGSFSATVLKVVSTAQTPDDSASQEAVADKEDGSAAKRKRPE